MFQSVHVGSNLTLKCITDDSYEYCIWRHKSYICEFVGKRSEDEVLKQRCPTYLTNRIK